MIALETWEREKLEAELLYKVDAIKDLSGELPEEFVLLFQGVERSGAISFLLIQSPDGLAYESFERVAFKPCSEPRAWRIVL